MAVGILVTLAASYAPARRATRVPPIAALREGAELPRTWFSRFIPVRRRPAPGRWNRAGAPGSYRIGADLCAAAHDRGRGDPLIRRTRDGVALPDTPDGPGDRLAARDSRRRVGPAGPREHHPQPRAHRRHRGRADDRDRPGGVLLGAINGFKESFLGSIDRSVTSNLIIQNHDQSAPVPTAAVAAASNVAGVDAATGIAFTDVKIGNGGTDVAEWRRSDRAAAALQLPVAEGRLQRAARQAERHEHARRGAIRQVPPPLAGIDVPGDERRRPQADAARDRPVQGSGAVRRIHGGARHLRRARDRLQPAGAARALRGGRERRRDNARGQSRTSSPTRM